MSSDKNGLKPYLISRVNSHIKPDLDFRSTFCLTTYGIWIFLLFCSNSELSSLISRNSAVDIYAPDLLKISICNSPIWLACLWHLSKTDHCKHQQRNKWLDNIHFLQEKKSSNWWNTASGLFGRSLSPRIINFIIARKC